MVALTVIHAFEGHEVGARLVEPAVVKAALASHRSHVAPTPLTDADKAEVERLKDERAKAKAAEASAKETEASGPADEAVEAVAKALTASPAPKTGTRA